MKYRSLTFALLSISATAEKAAEIEGDLLEQSHIYGKWWMRSHVLLIALSLFGRALSRNPGAISALCVTVFAAIFLSVALSERLFNGAVGSYLLQELSLPLNAAKIAVLGATVVPLAYLIGVGLVRSAPVLGPRAAAAVALVFSVFVTVMQLYVYYRPSTIPLSLLKVGVAIALVAVPLLWGAMSTQRRLNSGPRI
jgi:hypothetical protein